MKQAALQNGSKKRYKRAVKGLAAVVANFGCLTLQCAEINSAVAVVQILITICASKSQRMLLLVMA